MKIRAWMVISFWVFARASCERNGRGTGNAGTLAGDAASAASARAGAHRAFYRRSTQQAASASNDHYGGVET